MRLPRYSLRTLFIVVTLAAAASAYVAHENRIVQERNAIAAWAQENNELNGAGYYDHPPSISWIRRLLGDSGADFFVIPHGVAEREKARIKAAFPEAEIIDADPWDYSPSAIPSAMPGDPPRPLPMFFRTDPTARQASNVQ